nr:hypothetical protein [Streptomyces sp. ISL-21]
MLQTRRNTRSGEQPAHLSGEQEITGLELVTPYELAQNRDERRMCGHRTGFADGPTFRMATPVDLAVVRPLTAHLGFRRVGKKLTPAAFRQRRVGDAQGDGLLREHHRTGLVQERLQRQLGRHLRRGRPVPSAVLVRDSKDAGLSLLHVSPGARAAFTAHAGDVRL